MRITETELTYKQTPEAALQMRIYSGETDNPKPVLVLFYGGGWKSRNLLQFEPQARHFARQGWLVFLPEYRVFNEHGTSPDACVEDGKSAVRWVREQAELMGGEPDNVVFGGGSAGGHVALSVAVVEGFDDPWDDMSVSTLPRALVLFNPVVDTTETGFNRHGLDPETARRISPLHCVPDNPPPVILFHGEADTVVAFSDARRFETAWKAANGMCQLVSYADMEHGFFNFGSADNVHYHDTLSRTEAFLGDIGIKTNNE